MRGQTYMGFSPPIFSFTEFWYGSLVWQWEWKRSQRSPLQLPTEWQFKSCWRKSVWSASTTGFYKGSNHVVTHSDTWKECCSDMRDEATMKATPEGLHIDCMRTGWQQGFPYAAQKSPSSWFWCRRLMQLISHRSARKLTAPAHSASSNRQTSKTFFSWILSFPFLFSLL